MSPEISFSRPDRVNDSQEIGKMIKSFRVIEDNTETNEFIRCINNGDVPIILANHRSLADIFAIYNVINSLNLDINNNLKGFYLPVAASLTTGDQNEYVTRIYSEIVKQCSLKNIFFTEVLRPKDIEKYKIDPNSEQSRQYKRNLLTILSIKENNHGLILFPEGTTQAGRYSSETKKPYGHHPLEGTNIADSLISKFLDQNIRFVVLPLIINDSEKVFSPDTYESDFTQTATVKIGHVLKPLDFNKKSQPTFDVMNYIFSEVQ